jgi:hypothetical protein
MLKKKETSQFRTKPIIENQNHLNSLHFYTKFIRQNPSHHISITNNTTISHIGDVRENPFFEPFSSKK